MNFIDELKRRKVIRVGITYAVVAFVIMQLVEIIFPIFQIPIWASQFAIILLIIGFPVTLILGWIFDRSPAGIVKKSSSAELGEQVKPGIQLFYQNKRNLMLVAGVVSGLLIGRYGIGSLGSDTYSDVDPKSVAVLPFDNYSTAPEDQFFSDGITEVIIANLAKVKDLKVISRTSVMEYKKTTKKMNEIAGELGVAHILEGSIQRVGDNIRIVGQLINAYSDEHIWAETYDGHISDVFTMQTDVAIKIAQALESELTDDEKARINEKLTESTAAYEYYLRGNMYDNAGHTVDNIRASIAEYDRAVTLDPDFAEAHAQLGKMHAHMKWYKYDLVSSRMEKSKWSIDRAMELKPNNAIVRTARGVYNYHGFREYGKAMADFTFALDLEPGNARFNLYVGTIYRRLGDFEKATQSMEAAAKLDPRSNLVLYNLAGSLMALRYYDAVSSIVKRAEDLGSNPTTKVHFGIGAAFQVSGDALEARRDLNNIDFVETDRWQLHYSRLARDYEKIIEILVDAPGEFFGDVRLYFPRDYYLGLAAMETGRQSAARTHFNSSLDHLKEKIENYSNDPRFYATLGLTYARLGENEKAVEAGLKATEVLSVALDAMFGTHYEKQLAAIYAIVGDSNKALDKIEYLSSIPNGFHYGELKVDPDFDSVRDEPRFQAVLQKLKLVS